MANTHDTLHVLMNGKLTGTLHKRRGGSDKRQAENTS